WAALPGNCCNRHIVAALCRYSGHDLRPAGSKPLATLHPMPVRGEAPSEAALRLTPSAQARLGREGAVGNPAAARDRDPGPPRRARDLRAGGTTAAAPRGAGGRPRGDRSRDLRTEGRAPGPPGQLARRRAGRWRAPDGEPANFAPGAPPARPRAR